MSWFETGIITCSRDIQDVTYSCPCLCLGEISGSKWFQTSLCLGYNMLDIAPTQEDAGVVLRGLQESSILAKYPPLLLICCSLSKGHPLGSKQTPTLHLINGQGLSIWLLWW